MFGFGVCFALIGCCIACETGSRDSQGIYGGERGGGGGCGGGAEALAVVEAAAWVSVAVTYEKLYYTDNAEEWMRIFHHLGIGPQQNLSLDSVFGKATIQKTSANDRSNRMGKLR